MGNDLRERLEVLKEKSEQTCLSECEREFRMELAIAFRSGDLITRQELDEAVAKAVAEEREACLNAVEECAYTPDNDIEEAFVNGVAASEEAIRARSEQKEGE